jgi:hypothetical protein
MARSSKKREGDVVQSTVPKRKSARNQPSRANDDDTVNPPNPASAVTGSNLQLDNILEGDEENAGDTTNAGIAVSSAKTIARVETLRRAKDWSDSRNKPASTLTTEAVAVASITEEVAETIASLRDAATSITAEVAETIASLRDAAVTSIKDDINAVIVANASTTNSVLVTDITTVVNSFRGEIFNIIMKMITDAAGPPVDLLGMNVGLPQDAVQSLPNIAEDGVHHAAGKGLLDL